MHSIKRLLTYSIIVAVVALIAPVSCNQVSNIPAQTQQTSTPTKPVPTSVFGAELGKTKSINLEDMALVPLSLAEEALIQPNKTTPVQSQQPGEAISPEAGLKTVTALASPCQGGRHSLTQHFNWVPGMDWHTAGYHPGLDLVCGKNRETVVATAPGIVWWAKWIDYRTDQDSVLNWVSGNTVNEKISLQTKQYGTVDAFVITGHMMKLFVSEGQQIALKTPLGIQGNTGYIIAGAGNDGTHVHLGTCIKLNGTLFWLNPATLLGRN